MGIFDKIEEIRKKPEHIRMRYVWAMVVVSMFFVFGIWIISFKNNISRIDKNQINDPSVKNEIIDNLKEGGKALNDVKKGIDQYKSLESQMEKK